MTMHAKKILVGVFTSVLVAVCACEQAPDVGDGGEDAGADAQPQQDGSPGTDSSAQDATTQDVATDAPKDSNADAFDGNTGCGSDGSCTCTTGTCNPGCFGGSCTFDCKKGTTCVPSCSGGGCTITCESGASCDTSCSGGGCTFICQAGSTCTNLCTGPGNCTFQCDAQATCNNSCPKNNCH